MYIISKWTKIKIPHYQNGQATSKTRLRNQIHAIGSAIN